jgi:hypothetical protein
VGIVERLDVVLPALLALDEASIEAVLLFARRLGTVELSGRPDGVREGMVGGLSAPSRSPACSSISRAASCASTFGRFCSFSSG